MGAFPTRAAQFVQKPGEALPRQQRDPLPRSASDDEPGFLEVARHELLGVQGVAEVALGGHVVAVVGVGLLAAGRLARPERRGLHQVPLVGAVHDQTGRCHVPDRAALQRSVDRVELRTRLRRIADRGAQPAGLGQVLRQPRQWGVGDLVEEHADAVELLPLRDFGALPVDQLIHQRDRLRGDRPVGGG